MKKRWIKILILACLGLSALLWLGPAQPVRAVTGQFDVVIIRMLFTDDSSSPNTLAKLQQAAPELENYFSILSHGLLTLDVKWVTDVNMSHDTHYYFDRCLSSGETRNPCPPHFMEEAIRLAHEAGKDFSHVETVMYVYPFGGKGFANDYLTVTAAEAGIDGRFLQAHCSDAVMAESAHAAPGPSGVSWGCWAHEVGHTLQLYDRIRVLGTTWLGHPSAYAPGGLSGYDLMDSCYPCGDSAYSLSGRPVMNGEFKVFPGWLPADKVVTIPAPSSGTSGEMVTLAPITEDPAATPHKMAIKVPISSSTYYLVQARRRYRADSYAIGPGIWDEGIQILKVDENHDAPVDVIDTCRHLYGGGCAPPASQCQDPAHGNIYWMTYVDGQTNPHCWPYPLWHVGNTYEDTTENIQISVTAEAGYAFTVSVTRGVPPGHPDVFVLPWQTPPTNTWESLDIWVDSSCNGYEEVVGSRGLRYGRRWDNTVIGNGDNPCINHPNRIYARVHNGGNRTATDVQVTFKVTNPLGVGIRGASGWTTVGTATSAQFSNLATMAPGAVEEVWVEWIPERYPPPTGSFNYHSCIQVEIAPVTGEVVTSNQDGIGEQENIDVFEAVRSTPLDAPEAYQPIDDSFFLSNQVFPQEVPADRTFYLHPRENLPEGWTYSVADGQQALTLGPEAVYEVSVEMEVPISQPVGETYELEVYASTIITYDNSLAPAGWPGGNPRQEAYPVAGVSLQVQTVLDDDLSLEAGINQGGYIVARGLLIPGPGYTGIVAIDYIDPADKATTRIVQLEPDGHYQDTFTPYMDGTWKVQAIWQGDERLASTVSPVAEVLVDYTPNPPGQIPWIKQPVTLDGACGKEEYLDAAYYTYPEANSDIGVVHLKQDEKYLFACVSGPAGTFEDRFFSLYLDTNNGKEDFAREEDLALRVDVLDSETSSYKGSGVENGWVSATVPDWMAQATTGNRDEAEYILPIRLTGGNCDKLFGMALYHHWLTNYGDDYGWPSNQYYDQPVTWETMRFTLAPCQATPRPEQITVFLPMVIR